MKIILMITATVLLFGINGIVVQALELPKRNSPIPETTNHVPHIQIGDVPAAIYSTDLLQRVAEIPDVSIRKTVVSLPGAKGFWIDEKVALAHPEAIVGGREFAHLHPDGSLHAALAPDLAKVAVDNNWAIYHPWSRQRDGWEGFVMIYTPSTKSELEQVFKLIIGSYKYVTGRN